MNTTERDPVIRLKRVTKSYREGEREHVVLRAIDAHILPAEFVVLLGRSGSGKSTLLNLLSGIDLPDEGEVDVCGERLTTLSERDLTTFRRSRIGLIFQFFNLIPTLTVWENVCLRLELNRLGSPADVDRAASLLSEVGLADRKDSYPDRLSGGEQQRVAIASALVHQPDLVLADEPTGNLDHDTGSAVVSLLDTVVRQQGRTLVMATHSDQMVGVADRIVILDKGRFRQLEPGAGR